MTMHARVLKGALALTLAMGLIAVSPSQAEDKDAKATVEKIAGLIAKKDDAGAAKEAQSVGKKASLDDVMGLFRLRAKGGLGVGKAGSVTPDGIEAKLIGLGRKPLAQAQLDKEADDLAKAAIATAAIAELALQHAPDKDMGMKKKKDWVDWSKEMRDSAVALADAAKAKKPDAVKTAAAKLNSSCNNCHGVFRD